MRCYACQQPNSDTARFCVECGASLALTTWAQPAPAVAPYAPQPAAQMVAVTPAPAAYPPGASGPNSAYAPYGYMPAPAPMPAPSMVNNVSLAQTPPATLVNNVSVAQASPTQAAPAVAADRHASGFGILMRAAYFLGSGLVVGSLWVGALQQRYYYDGSSSVWAVGLAFVLTIVVLLLNIAILDRLARK